MTNIQNELKERIAVYKNPSDAEKRFAEQKKRIQELQNLEGMKEIRAFWLAQEQQALSDLTKVNPKEPYELAKIQAKYELANKFNKFIEVRIK